MFSTGRLKAKTDIKKALKMFVLNMQWATTSMFERSKVKFAKPFFLLQIAEPKNIQHNAMELHPFCGIFLKKNLWHLGKLNFDHPSTQLNQLEDDYFQ